jgi:hypothetical protein
LDVDSILLSSGTKRRRGRIAMKVGDSRAWFISYQKP